MPSERENMESWTPGQIADSMAGAGLGTLVHNRASAEFLRRQTVALQEGAKAQQEASAAAIKTAKFTRLNAWYMLASVLVLAAASVLNLIVTVFHISK
jgi:hypothetical protein